MNRGSTTSSKPARWNPALDGLRGVAILLVMPFHFARTFDSQGMADRALSSLAATGYLGVDLFFVLSGFLITRMLLSAKGSSGYFGRFYARRALRIFPLYYALLAALVLVAPEVRGLAQSRPVQVTQAHQAWFWTHTVNWLLARTGSFGTVAPEVDVMWSLSIEVQFYLLWPLIVLLLEGRRLAVACVAGVAASVGLRAWLLAHGASPVTVYTGTFTHFDALGVGAAIACLRSCALESRALHLIRRSWWLAILAFDLALLVPRNGGISAPALTAVFLCAALGWGGVLLATLDGAPEARWARLMRNRALQRFGLYSYGLYLLHPWAEAAMPRLGLSASALTGFVGSALAGHAAYITLAVAGALAAAAASYHLIEAPFLALKRRIPLLTGLGVESEIRALELQV